LFEMYNRAGRINVGKRDKEGNLKHDCDIQKFKDLSFRIKVETLPTEENLARIFFLKKDKEEEIPIPDGITVVDVTFENNVVKDPVVSGANWYLVTHPYKYNIYYDPKKNRCTREYKIYSLNAGKDYTIIIIEKLIKY
ncbi:16184_t:CDS:1, partial [Cetraspora pellucida]